MILERLDIENNSDLLQVALHRQRYDFVLKRLPPGQNVLEIGTGLGAFTRELFPRCGRYAGIEFDPDACDASRKKNPAAEIIQGDARQLPFDDNQFSFIICLEVLEHLGDWQAGVKNIHRCLQSDGTAIISVPWRRIGGKSKINKYHLYEPGEAELVSLFKRLFNNVEIHYQYFEETSWMTFARKLHLRRFLDLSQTYADLSRGLSTATSHLKIEPTAKGMKMGLILRVWTKHAE
ncbi:MAG TPA: methyltransferase domain-containing protein [Verrucomicrobiae bacterium]|nr:methyltransferase domain-containing protein [Verrucomicrobiae bacterium]